MLAENAWAERSGAKAGSTERGTCGGAGVCIQFTAKGRRRLLRGWGTRRRCIAASGDRRSRSPSLGSRGWSPLAGRGRIRHAMAML